MEQKNHSVVRRAVGYRHYDTEEELIVLNELYDAPRLYTNFFEAGDESDREDTVWEQGCPSGGCLDRS